MKVLAIEKVSAIQYLTFITLRAQQGVKQSVCLLSIVCQHKISKSKHLSESRLNKWDKMV